MTTPQKATEKNLPKILLADDDSDDRDLFGEAASLINDQLNVTMAKDGEELLDVLIGRQFRPDLIFLDLNMPRKNGKECLVEINNHEELSKIPVIIFSTSLNPLDVEDTFNSGAHYFFRKPNSFEELKGILQKIIETGIENSTPRVREKFVLNSQFKAAAA